jgi:acetyl/propionyl-CoA carboxylase alpha subunit
VRQVLEVNGRIRQISARRTDVGYLVEMDGREWAVDAVRAGRYTVSLLVSERPHGGETGKQSGNADSGRMLSYEITVVPGPLRHCHVHVGSMDLLVMQGRPRHPAGTDHRASLDSGPRPVVAPMPGRVVRVMVNPGERVHARQPVAIVEAMKMENELTTTRAGVVLDVPAQVGQLVETGAVLVIVGDGV